MSGVVKGVKKAFKSVGEAVTGVVKGITKVADKVVRSKAFKVALGAATVYFGGAALTSMAGGGTAAAGLGSAWGGLQGAGSALMAGNFSGAASALGSGFMGTYGTAAATAAGSTLAGAAPLTQVGSSLSAPLIGEGAAVGLSNGVLTAGASAPVSGLASMGLSAPGAISTAANSAVSSLAGSGAAKGGLLSGAWNGLGEAGKAAAVMSGVNMAGQMIQGHAAEKAAKEERERRTYWGVDGAGRTAQSQPDVGNLNYANPYPNQPAGYTQPPQWQPKTLDDLINETRNLTNANSGLLWG